MKFIKNLATAFLCVGLFTTVIAQEKCLITVKVDKPTAEIQPTMWGVFFEDINMGADGGIYAELVARARGQVDTRRAVPGAVHAAGELARPRARHRRRGTLAAAGRRWSSRSATRATGWPPPSPRTSSSGR